MHVKQVSTHQLTSRIASSSFEAAVGACSNSMARPITSTCWLRYHTQSGSVAIRKQPQNDEFPAAPQGVRRQTQTDLSQARILVPLVLHHHVWWGAAIDPETVHRATTQPRRELAALHLQPSTSRALPGALGAEGVGMAMPGWRSQACPLLESAMALDVSIQKSSTRPYGRGSK
jgi:hypothetical protein